MDPPAPLPRRDTLAHSDLDRLEADFDERFARERLDGVAPLIAARRGPTVTSWSNSRWSGVSPRWSA